MFADVSTQHSANHALSYVAMGLLLLKLSLEVIVCAVGKNCCLKEKFKNTNMPSLSALYENPTDSARTV